MLRLSDGIQYLVLGRELPPGRHYLRFVNRFDDALRFWDGGCRISPVFPTTTSFSAPPRYWITFVGPVHPGVIDPRCADEILLSHGLYNLLLINRRKSSLAKTRKAVANLSLPSEEWQIKRGVVEDIIINSSQPATSPGRAPAPGTDRSLREAAREHSLVVGTAIGRANASTPQLVSDLQRFEVIFSRLLRNKKDSNDTVGQLELLVNANAALSRFSSQTYAGISPITETECHFWSHSLLGIGTASLALVSIRRFIETRLLAGGGGFTARLSHLRNLPSKEFLGSLSAADPFWQQDHISPPPPNSVHIDLEEKTTLPLITFFSARDGFRSTHISLSGPLELVSSCNTVAWTLHTLTHEISHPLVAAALNVFIPRRSSETDYDNVCRLIRFETEPLTLFDNVQQYLGYAIIGLEDPDHRQPVSPGFLMDVLQRRGGEIQELLTHVFDFLYFYAGDSAAYIKSLWLSWGTLPNIDHRITQYLIRSLCALHAINFINRAPIDSALDELSARLNELLVEFPMSPYLTTACQRLSSNRTELRRELSQRVHLVRFVRGFLYSNERMASLHADEGTTGSLRTPYRLIRQNVFAEQRVLNPLRFMSTFCRDKSPDIRRSFWILQQLAFAVGE